MYVLNKYKQKDKGVWYNFGTKKTLTFLQGFGIGVTVVYSDKFNFGAGLVQFFKF
jgi:hypothetical protein